MTPGPSPGPRVGGGGGGFDAADPKTPAAPPAAPSNGAAGFALPTGLKVGGAVVVLFVILFTILTFTQLGNAAMAHTLSLSASSSLVIGSALGFWVVHKDAANMASPRSAKLLRGIFALALLLAALQAFLDYVTYLPALSPDQVPKNAVETGEATAFCSWLTKMIDTGVVAVTPPLVADDSGACPLPAAAFPGTEAQKGAAGKIRDGVCQVGARPGMRIVKPQEEAGGSEFVPLLFSVALFAVGCVWYGLSSFTMTIARRGAPAGPASAPAAAPASAPAKPRYRSNSYVRLHALLQRIRDDLKGNDGDAEQAIVKQITTLIGGGPRTRLRDLEDGEDEEVELILKDIHHSYTGGTAFDQAVVRDHLDAYRQSLQQFRAQEAVPSSPIRQRPRTV